MPDTFFSCKVLVAVFWKPSTKVFVSVVQDVYYTIQLMTVKIKYCPENSMVSNPLLLTDYNKLEI